MSWAGSDIDTLLVMEFGWGKHLWDVTLADLAKFNKASLSMFGMYYDWLGDLTNNE